MIDYVVDDKEPIVGFIECLDIIVKILCVILFDIPSGLRRKLLVENRTIYIFSYNIQLECSSYKSIFVYLLANNEHHMVNTEQNHSLNRLKIVLVEQGKSGRWLAERVNKSEHTISRWCQNKTQPSVAQLNEIAQILGVDVRSLINSTI